MKRMNKMKLLPSLTLDWLHFHIQFHLDPRWWGNPKKSGFTKPPRQFWILELGPLRVLFELPVEEPSDYVAMFNYGIGDKLKIRTDRPSPRNEVLLDNIELLRCYNGVWVAFDAAERVTWVTERKLDEYYMFTGGAPAKQE